MDPQNSLANLEALLNIVCNGIEVLGIAAGIPYLALGWIPMACGARGYSSKMYIACIAMIALAFLTPPIVNSLISMSGGANRSLFLGLGIVVGLVFAFATIALCFAVALAPTIMAMREKLPSKGLIIGLNVGSFIVPILWLPSLIVASLAVTKRNTAPIIQLIKDRRSEHEQKGEG